MLFSAMVTAQSLYFISAPAVTGITRTTSKNINKDATNLRESLA